MFPISQATQDQLVLIDTFLKSHCSAKRSSQSQRELVLQWLSIKFQHMQIEPEDQVFFPADKQERLCQRNYKSIRDAVAIMKNYSNHAEGVCDLITGWTDEFDQLFISILNSRIKLEKKQCKQKSKQQKFQFLLIPGADESNYRKTERSNRLYHPAQNLTREQKSSIYAGMLDFDIVSCFPQIFKQHVLGPGVTHPMLDLMLDHPDTFLQLIQDSNAYTNDVRSSGMDGRSKAKRMRSRLFHPPAEGRLRRINVRWYDDLADWIQDRLTEVTEKGMEHLFFTAVEQVIIDTAMDVIGRKRVRLRMHDGFIASEIEDADEVLRMLESSTGFRWKCNQL